MVLFQWNSGQLVQLGWSNTDDLLCVLEDGAVLMYDMFGTYQHTFGMGQVSSFVIYNAELLLVPLCNKLFVLNMAANKISTLHY